MKLTPLQERLITAYQHPVHDHAPTQKSQDTSPSNSARDGDRVELSPQAAAAQRIRSRLIAARVNVPAIPQDIASVGSAAIDAESLPLHRTPAAINAAATGVAAGIRLDTVA